MPSMHHLDNKEAYSTFSASRKEYVPLPHRLRWLPIVEPNVAFLNLTEDTCASRSSIRSVFEAGATYTGGSVSSIGAVHVAVGIRRCGIISWGQIYVRRRSEDYYI